MNTRTSEERGKIYIIISIVEYIVEYYENMFSPPQGHGSMYAQIWLLWKNLSNFPIGPRIAALFKCNIQRLSACYREGGKKKRREG